jgi:hypothetical protein
MRGKSRTGTSPATLPPLRQKAEIGFTQIECHGGRR